MNDNNTTYDYSPVYTTGPATTIDTGAMLAFFGFTVVAFIIFYVIVAVFLGMIFKKAGIESWKAWVPIYNTWVLLEMGDQPGWWSLLSLIPFVNIVASVFLYIAMYYIGLRFQKDGVFVLLAIFFPLVWVIWLAVDKSVWTPTQSANLANGSNTPPPSQPVAM